MEWLRTGKTDTATMISVCYFGIVHLGGRTLRETREILEWILARMNEEK
jgi:hypothetical protein